MCNMDCFNCCKPDCDNDELTTAERNAQTEYDREIIYDRKFGREKVLAKYDKSEKGKARTKKYRNSAKGKEATRRYETSEKGKERYRRYCNSERGQSVRKQYRDQLVATGKNAEYCRAYYYRKKAQKMMEGGVE